MNKPFFLVEELADYYTESRFKDLPVSVVERARWSLADFIAVVVLGYRKGVLPTILDPYLLGLGGKAESTWLSRREKSPAITAALSMGAASHSVELDDGHRFGTAHPAVAIFPAVLSISERENSSFEEMLRAIVLGYDGMLRLARAINPSHLHRGFHTTGTCGSVGAALSTACLLGLDREQMVFAISIAALQSAGLQEMLHDHPSIKPLQAGKAAMNGVLAADLASKGAMSPRTVLEGQHGWLKAYTDEFKREDLLQALGRDFEIMNIYTKLYPTCRHCHPSIDLALMARAAAGFRLEGIKSIFIETYRVAISEVAGISEPSTTDEAMFSLSFAVAVALVHGRVSLSEYTNDYFRDQKLAKLQRLVRAEAHSDFDDHFPKERGARMKIEWDDGTCWQEVVHLPQGEPEKPVSKSSLREKFDHCILDYFDHATAGAVWHECVEREINSASYAQILETFSAGLGTNKEV